jgi:hypothetical protein
MQVSEWVGQVSTKENSRAKGKRKKTKRVFGILCVWVGEISDMGPNNLLRGVNECVCVWKFFEPCSYSYMADEDSEMKSEITCFKIFGVGQQATGFCKKERMYNWFCRSVKKNSIYYCK